MKKNNTKRILVTGAAGFIGFHLISALKKQGHFVVGMDNFNDYYSPTLKRDRAKVLAELDVKIYEQDICEQDAIFKLCKENQITHLVHLAAQAGVRYSVTHPDIFLKTNIDGFLQVLEACKRCEGIKLVYASSSSVYGFNEKVPSAIDDKTDKPSNIYGVTKKTNELMAYAYNRIYNLCSVGLRFFTVYGPWGRPDMACFSFTKKIFEGQPVDLYNFGNMKRDFTYIDDIVDGILASLNIEEGYHLFNLGNHKSESLHELIEIIENETGKKAITNLLPCPLGEILETCADITESSTCLNFYPKTELADGMHHFVKWYKSYYN
jgi:UDP-glucuronate 4-epimerase